jgi:hypothetical protein
MSLLDKVKDALNVLKPSVQQDGVDPKILSKQRNSDPLATADRKGIDGDKLIEPVPKFIEAPSEKVMSNSNNSWIVLGRDRPGGRSSGYGGKGDTQAASIDLVCGRMGHKVRSVDKKTGEALWTDPDFQADAARIYISQKTDLDKNFDLQTGKVGTSSAKSGIAIKADGIRLVAREGIKLVTSESKQNSQGGDIQATSGIDLIAGNADSKKDNTDLQPIPKGDNLARALKRLTFHVEKLNGIVDSMLMTQMNFNMSLMHHWHHSPFFVAPTAPSAVLAPEGVQCVKDSLTKVKVSLATHKANLVAFKNTYLKQSGKKYINSRFNNVN